MVHKATGVVALGPRRIRSFLSSNLCCRTMVALGPRSIRSFLKSNLCCRTNDRRPWAAHHEQLFCAAERTIVALGPRIMSNFLSLCCCRTIVATASSVEQSSPNALCAWATSLEICRCKRALSAMSAFLVCFFSPSSAVASGPNHFREEEKELQVPLVLFLNYFLTFVF